METEVSPTAMALDKRSSEPQLACLYRGFPQLALHIAQKAFPLHVSEYALLAEALELQKH